MNSTYCVFMQGEQSHIYILAVWKWKNANVLGRKVLQRSLNLKGSKLCESFSDKSGKNPVFDFRGSSACVCVWERKT